jgi:predicted Zn-dependent protease
MAPISLNRYAILASLCAATALAPLSVHAQQATVQDGIKVRPLSTSRIFAGGADFNAQSKQQYAQLVNEAKEKNALVPDSDPQVKRLRAIAQRIIPFATRWNEAAADWNWQVNLLNSDQVNAFCMPGGQIAFYSGIITKLNLTDDEVAIVMGHEISHALREHSQAQAGKSNLAAVGAKLAGAGLSAWLGVDPSITSTATNMAAQGVMLKFSRDDEREADLIGMDLAARAGFDPRAGIALWQKMGSVNKSQPLPFLSTHPSGKDRINEMNKSMHLVLPVFAKAKGLDPDKLPAYRSLALPSS